MIRPFSRLVKWGSETPATGEEVDRNTRMWLPR